MAQFVTRRGRSSLAGLLLLCVFCLLLGFIFMNLKGYPMESWPWTFGIGLYFLGMFGVLSLSFYLGNSWITGHDLLVASEDQLAEDVRIAKAWSKVEIQKASFRELSRSNKTAYILSIFLGFLFTAYGILDAFGYFRPIYIPKAEGGLLAMPRWLSSVIEIVTGLVFLFLTPGLIKFRMVERIEETLKKLVKQGKVIIFPPRDTKH